MLKNIILFLRKTHGNIYEWKLDKKRRFSILWNISTHKVLIIGTPEHDNLGDSAIVLSTYLLLEDAGILEKDIYEIPYSEYNFIEENLGLINKKHKLIIGIGGGNFGDLWYNEHILRRSFINRFKKCRIIIFPQTILFENEEHIQEDRELFAKTKNLTLCAREQKSYELMTEYYGDVVKKVLLIPDTVLYADKKRIGFNKNENRKDVLFLMRKDKEKCVSDDTVKKIILKLDQENIGYRISDTFSQYRANKENRKKLIVEKLEEISGAKFVVTDRLHGMVFAAITETPCIVFGNNHHKVKGTYEWISYLPYIQYVNNYEEAIVAIDQIKEIDLVTYDKSQLIPYFDYLKEKISYDFSNRTSL